MQTIKIVNGPSKEELFDALKLYNEKRLIPFGIIRVGEEPRKPGEESFLVTFIQSIQAEDGSGQSWNITFRVEKEAIDIALNPPRQKIYEPGVATVGKIVGFSTMKNWIQWERESMQRDHMVQGCAPRKNTIEVKAHFSTKTRHGVITIEE